MKTLTLLLAILISLSAFTQSQYGFKTGINTTFFTGGDKNYSGISHNYQSLTGGFFAKFKHLQVEVLFAQSGAKNPKEDNRTFKVYNIVVPVTFKANAGNFNFQIGGYVGKVVGASNSDFFTEGVNFGWSSGEEWFWYQGWDYGLDAGIGIKWDWIFIEAHYRQGLENVRRGNLGWNGQRDYSYEHCLNSSIEASVYFPLIKMKRRYAKPHKIIFDK